MHTRPLLLVSAALCLCVSLLSAASIPGFSTSPYFNEQIRTFNYPSDVRIQINAPSASAFDPAKPTALAFFALPNGNTIEMTVGKTLKAGDDWHYDIQHIGAQTRFIRSKASGYNFVTVYLEANASTIALSWPTWRAKYANNAALVKSIVDSVRSMFASYQPYVVLSSHSGGGGFEFSYFNAVSEIPADIRRITFLDSEYNYDNSYGPKLKAWLDASPDHFLSALAYNDSVALLNGQPVVSATGGTWYRTKMMVNYLGQYYPFTMDSNATFITYTALNGRIKVILKQNPTRAILHTVQVELNGFIQTMLSGTSLEEQGYAYYGARAYTPWIQSGSALPNPIQIPARPAGAVTGSQFMASVQSMTFAEREEAIYQEISKGNIPDFLRTTKKIQSSFQDANGQSHDVVYEVLPDYLAIGSDADFCRIPMGPVTAQRLANLFGASLPTPKLVDDIYAHAELKVPPVTYAPVGNANEQVSKFVEHNQAIEAQRTASGKPLGALMGGTKKDVVLSNKITDPARPNHVVIYGWHQMDGTAIQPVTNIHIDSYVDYSHGIRFINNELLVDSTVMKANAILTNATLYKILSNEAGAMTQPSYLKTNAIPAVPKSFGFVPESPTSIRLRVKADSIVTEYQAFISKDGAAFPAEPVKLSVDTPVITGLEAGTLYYIKIRAANLNGASASSELLACATDASDGRMLIVNGFDRASTGNTYDFVRRHAPAFRAAGVASVSATNDAVTDGLFSLSDYQIVDYILGDESTADETFSTAEQAKVKAYLQAGGRLFVSGAELAWDLDNKGSAADKDFFNTYLKAKYAADAPNNVSASVYAAEALAVGPFAGLSQIAFDNGTHGSIDVKWPDVMKASAGGAGFLKYAGLDTSNGFGGICFAGLMPGGSKEAKTAVLGFPFETIYTESVRNEFAGRLLNYFGVPSSVETRADGRIPSEYRLLQNYPNPFNPSTKIAYDIPKSGRVRLAIYDALGREVVVLVDRVQEAGSYTDVFDAAGLANGMYIAQLTAGGKQMMKKLLLVK
ncbi:MAG: T9SS type A sorting domain-containing protein [Acidobacteriota bacterium]